MKEPTGAERAREAAYREFMEPGALPEGARMDEAERVLGAMLEKELGDPVDEPRTSAAHPARRAPSRAGRGRTMLGLAATIVVLAGVSWFALNQPGGERVLRGNAPVATGRWDAQPATEPTANGGVRLSWRSAPGANSYTVVFLAADLSELARVSARAETSIVLAPEARPSTLQAGAEGMWRVEAFAGRDEVGRSPTLPIAFP